VRVDEGPEAEGGGGVEDALEVLLAGVQQTGVAARGGEAGVTEGGGEFVGVVDEAERLDVRVADVGDALQGAGQIGAEGIADRVELDRERLGHQGFSSSRWCGRH
jgi:hypothetical protein